MQNIFWPKLLLVIVSALSSLLAIFAISAEPAKDKLDLSDVPLIIYDQPITGDDLKNYRNTADAVQLLKEFMSDLNNKAQFSLLGLDTLNASASSQFSEAGLAKILQRAVGVPVIIDLRLESHGFVNGIPVSWYGFRNQYNLSKPAKQISREEAYLLAGLAGVGRVKVHTSSKTEVGDIIPGKFNVIKIKQVASEAELVASYGAEYKRFYILDHFLPTNSELDNFVAFIKELPDDRWLHFHCRGGVGRATTFMILYDMIHNANLVKVDDIINRQQALLSLVRKQSPKDTTIYWKVAPALEREKFIRDFYTYIVDPTGYAQRGWSEWVNMQHLRHSQQK